MDAAAETSVAVDAENTSDNSENTSELALLLGYRHEAKPHQTNALEACKPLYHWIRIRYS